MRGEDYVYVQYNEDGTTYNWEFIPTELGKEFLRLAAENEEKDKTIERLAEKYLIHVCPGIPTKKDIQQLIKKIKKTNG
jgi:hypothetical protein